MCPYCGEELEANAARCPRCGMVLDDAAAAVEEEAPSPGGPEVGAGGGAAASATAAEAPPRKKQLVPCPHCEVPIPASAHRCPECGRGLRYLVDESTQAAARRYKRKVQLAVGGGIALAAVALVVASLIAWSGEEKKGARKLERVTFDELDRFLGPRSKATPERREEFWDRVEGKDIRLQGRVAKVERSLFGGPALLIKHRRGEGDGADVRLFLSKEALEASKAAEGDLVTYMGRVVKYGGSLVVELEDGEIVEVKK
jgi:hypothetical protein